MSSGLVRGLAIATRGGVRWATRPLVLWEGLLLCGIGILGGCVLTKWALRRGLETEHVTVVSPRGRAVGWLGGTAYGGQLSVGDSTGKVRAYFLVDPDGTALLHLGDGLGAISIESHEPLPASDLPESLRFALPLSRIEMGQGDEHLQLAVDDAGSPTIELSGKWETSARLATDWAGGWSGLSFSRGSGLTSADLLSLECPNYDDANLALSSKRGVKQMELHGGHIWFYDAGGMLRGAR